MEKWKGYKEYRGVLIKRVPEEGAYLAIWEGVRMKVYGHLKEALGYVTQSDPWELWHDRNIVGEDFYIEVLN